MALRPFLAPVRVRGDGIQSAGIAAQPKISADFLKGEVGIRARCGRERPAEQAGELAPEETLEARLRGASLGADHALEGGAMLEKLWGSGLLPATAEACGGHVTVIGGDPPAHDPWRE